MPKSGGGQLTVYSGNDGGIFVSTDTMAHTLNSGGLQTGLFYNIDSKPDAGADVIVGALQDNGLLTTSGAPAAAPLQWSGRGQHRRLGRGLRRRDPRPGIRNQRILVLYASARALHPYVRLHRRRNQLPGRRYHPLLGR